MSSKFLKIGIIFFAVCLIALAGVCLWMVVSRDEPDPITPDYIAQETEKAQKPIAGDTSEKTDSSENGGSLKVTYGFNVVVNLSDEKATLFY